MARDKTPEIFLIIGIGLILTYYWSSVQSINREAQNYSKQSPEQQSYVTH